MCLGTFTGRPDRDILLTQTLFCLHSNRDLPQQRVSVTQHVGAVMGNDCCFIRKVLRSNACRVINNHGTKWRSWLRHCATSRKIAGSFSCDVTDVILATVLLP